MEPRLLGLAVGRGRVGLRGQLALGLGVVGPGLGIGPQPVAEQQREPLTGAVDRAEVDLSHVPGVGVAVEALLPLRDVRVLGLGFVERPAAEEPGLRELLLERIDGLERDHRDLDVDDVLGRNPGHGRRSDVVDADRSGPHDAPQARGQVLEAPGPARVGLHELELLGPRFGAAGAEVLVERHDSLVPQQRHAPLDLLDAVPVEQDHVADLAAVGVRCLGVDAPHSVGPVQAALGQPL